MYGRVEELLHKPRSSWDLDDLVTLVRTQGIRLVSLVHVGADGRLKALDFLPHSEAHVRAILTAGERADGSSLFASVGIDTTASDIVLRPRLHTAFMHPFAPLPTLAVLCEHRGRDGALLPESPQTIVTRAHARLQRDAGVDLWALGEVEYFLGMKAGDSAAYGRPEEGYHATTPFVFGETLRRQAMGILGDIGVAVKYAHSEVGYIEAKEDNGHIWEQHEIELALAPLPGAADAVILTQWVLLTLAHAQGLECRFDPMLQRGHAGSGLHFHFSPCRGGVHLPCQSADGELLSEAGWLIAGLVRYGSSLMAFGNRVPASFQRLSHGREVPRAITWGCFDRQALVRLPVVPGDDDGQSVVPATVEFRLPDGSVHPHLLLAGVAQAMLAARAEADIDAVLERSRGAATVLPAGKAAGADAVPRDFQEVGACLARDRGVFERDGVFPPTTIDAALRALAPGVVAAPGRQSVR